jgi:hypothetical protein
MQLKLGGRKRFIFNPLKLKFVQLLCRNKIVVKHDSTKFREKPQKPRFYTSKLHL